MYTRLDAWYVAADTYADAVAALEAAHAALAVAEDAGDVADIVTARLTCDLAADDCDAAYAVAAACKD